MFSAIAQTFNNFIFTSSIVLLLCVTMMSCNRNAINGVTDDPSHKKVDIATSKDKILSDLRKNADLLLIKKTESGSLYAFKRHGSNESLEKIISLISATNFDSYFKEGADSVVVIDYNISDADDSSLISKTSYVPVYKDIIELSSRVFKIDELFPESAEAN